MSVCLYQGVMPITMKKTGYSIPLTQFGASPSPGYFAGLIGSRVAVGSDCGSYQLPGPKPYNYDTLHFFPSVDPPISNPNLFRSNIYILSPSSLITIQLLGTPMGVGRDWYFNGNQPGLVESTNKLISLSGLQSAVDGGVMSGLMGSLYDASVSGSYSSPSDSTQYFVLPDTSASEPWWSSDAYGAINNLCGVSGPIITTANRIVYGVFFTTCYRTTEFTFSNYTLGATDGTAITAPLNMLAFDPVFDNPTGILGSVFAVTNFSAGLNYMADTDLATFSGVAFATFTVSDDLQTITITDTSAPTITFGGDPATGISAKFVASSRGPIPAFIKPVPNGWILGGSVLSDSQYYLASLNFGTYSNLRFVGGPVNPSAGPVMDAAGHWYTVDDATGEVWTSGGVTPPTPPAETILIPGIPYATPRVPVRMRLRKKKCC